MQEAANAFSATGGAASITSGRFSFALGLVGPCYSIDTACSSALSALHVSRRSLLNKECERCVGIGTKVLSEASNYGTAVAGMTSVHGRCHTFDARADGYCRGEGCGAYCVTGRRGARPRLPAILGSAVQQDGPSASLTAPNGSSQRRLVESVRGSARARCGGGDDTTLEAHGTGTALGDPIEVLAAWSRLVLPWACSCGLGPVSCGRGTVSSGGRRERSALSLRRHREAQFGEMRGRGSPVWRGGAMHVFQRKHGSLGSVRSGGGSRFASGDGAACWGGRTECAAAAAWLGVTEKNLESRDLVLGGSGGARRGYGNGSCAGQGRVP